MQTLLLVAWQRLCQGSSMELLMFLSLITTSSDSISFLAHACQVFDLLFCQNYVRGIPKYVEVGLDGNV
jgi:hypothetical protein